MQPTERKEMNILYHIVNNNIKTNKNQRNDAIENEPKFDHTFILSGCTKDPVPVVTVILQVGKKQRAMTVSRITCLWDSGATDSMIK